MGVLFTMSGMMSGMLHMARSAMGRAKRGLYEGKEVRFGNNVSFSKRRTRRRWNPNVQTKRLWSNTREKLVEFRVTTHALRCIKKAGGLDEYLVKSKHIFPGSKGDLLKQEINAAAANAAVLAAVKPIAAGAAEATQ